MSTAFNPPPSWPEPPEDDWSPEDGWRPDPAWGPVPAGWRLWTGADGDTRTDDGSPLLESEDVPASGARPIREEIPYPVEVTSPGNRRWLPRQDVTEDEFGPVVPFRRRPRLRLAVIIIVTVSGLLFAAATAYLFIHLAREAESLSAHPAAQGVAMAGTTPEGGAVPRHGASP